jgi:modulator of FtsH protease HflC
MRALWLIVGTVAVLVLARMSLFTVDPTEFAYVTEFGAPVATYDGAHEDDAGLHFRWPWPVQSVRYLDRRLQHFDLPATELLTHDPESKTVEQTLTVEVYVCWRILGKDKDPGAVDRFVRRLGTPAVARDVLGPRINSELGALVGQLRVDDLLSTETGGEGLRKVDRTMEKLRDQLLTALKAQARDEYGVEVVDIRLRRFNHPPGVRQSIFERISSERARKAEQYRSEGKEKADNITSGAEEKVRKLLANARKEERIRKGEADTEADRIRNRAHSADPELYVFLKKLEQMQSILGENKTLLLLSANRPAFDLLFRPPSPGAAPPRVMPNGGPPAPPKGPSEQPQKATGGGR